ncbi:hypothetical protein [Streptomyces alanosinicus]|uniref:Uncharacterized protein n=1 Tax=Streptomyces alanosinicus TaxID=68171 RepID=A0A918YQT2_9ACTN|nr:hypothetical protein [Streptomyces alanosinicus]GHE12554.1 hypothetical protein GCM10010339_76220 [Streptomyces alanosinicus]
MPLPAKVKPGDIVLSRGTGWISQAICLLDGSEVSHAALALEADRVAEAVGEGLRTINGDEVMKDHDLMVARTLAAPADMAPVIGVGNTYLRRGAKYAHQQVVLLAVLCVSRRIPLPRGGKQMVRTVLDQAAAAVNTMLERGQQPMICSEFVYRCYSEAQPHAPYTLRIGQEQEVQGDGTLLDWARTHPALSALRPPQPTAGFATAAAETALAPLVSAYAAATGQAAPLPKVPLTAGLPDPSDEELLSSMTSFGAALHKARTGPDGAATSEQALDAIRAKHAEPNFVTPGDLLRTASLGQVHRQSAPSTPLRGASALSG